MILNLRPSRRRSNAGDSVPIDPRGILWISSSSVLDDPRLKIFAAHRPQSSPLRRSIFSVFFHREMRRHSSAHGFNESLASGRCRDSGVTSGDRNSPVFDLVPRNIDASSFLGERQWLDAGLLSIRGEFESVTLHTMLTMGRDMRNIQRVVSFTIYLGKRCYPS